MAGSRPPAKRVVAALLERHGTTYCRELGINIEKNTPSPLFRWLVASTLFSTRISAHIAGEAARALSREGWTTAQRMADSTWEQRTRVLNRAGYARYDESTSRMLGENADMMLREYGGDLRRLRERAGRNVAAEKRLLREFKGIGGTGADIFFREAQAPWEEAYPYADRKALEAAKRLGLGDDAGALARHVSQADFPRLVAALVRTSLARDRDEILAAAR